MFKIIATRIMHNISLSWHWSDESLKIHITVHVHQIVCTRPYILLIADLHIFKGKPSTIMYHKYSSYRNEYRINPSDITLHMLVHIIHVSQL